MEEYKKKKSELEIIYEILDGLNNLLDSGFETEYGYYAACLAIDPDGTKPAVDKAGEEESHTAFILFSAETKNMERDKATLLRNFDQYPELLKNDQEFHRLAEQKFGLVCDVNGIFDSTDKNNVNRIVKFICGKAIGSRAWR